MGQIHVYGMTLEMSVTTTVTVGQNLQEQWPMCLARIGLMEALEEGHVRDH